MHLVSRFGTESCSHVDCLLVGCLVCQPVTDTQTVKQSHSKDFNFVGSHI